jgi:putative ABC transport system ATP-binding protein
MEGRDGMNQSNRHVLEMEAVTKRFGSGEAAVVAVDGVDLTVAAGEIVLIMGPSGSGKTTLLTMAGGLLKPTAGEIRVDGLAITGLSDRELSRMRREKIGFVFQSFNLLPALSALENVLVALNLAGKKGRGALERATQLLQDFEMEGRSQFRPEQLSGGERQRVSLARALANDPSLVLADEPTANLDSRRGHEVMELLRSIAKRQGRTVVIVSHDQRIRDIADRVLWLEDGRFRDLATVIHDPVCGMALDESRAAASSVYLGRTYHFCAAGCKKLFDEDPARFVMSNQQPTTGPQSGVIEEGT